MLKSGWWDPEYIENITKTIVGKNILEGLEAGGHGEDIFSLHLTLRAPVFAKLKSMNNGTLGKICGYGSPYGINHTGPWTGLGFINRTGLMDLCDPQALLVSFDDSYYGRDILRSLATDVIICIARDILMQDVWKEDQKAEEQFDHDLERAEHAMVHPNRHQ